MVLKNFISFSRFSVSLLPVMSYMTLSSREKPLFSENNSLMTPFFTLFVLSHASDKHYCSKYWGDGCLGRPHTSNFWGDRPPSPPLGLRLCPYLILSCTRAVKHLCSKLSYRSHNFRNL